MRGSAEFASISIAFKRIKNILQQAAEKGIAIPADLADSQTGEPQEVALEQTVRRILPNYRKLLLDRDYDRALKEMAKLREPTDAFFDRVMVMSEDAAQRARRLGLLSTLNRQFNQIADFSEIVAEGKT